MIDERRAARLVRRDGRRMPGRRGLLQIAACVVAPWLWFVVRDVHPRADLVAIGLPVAVAGAIGASLLLVAIQVWRRRHAPLARRIALAPLAGALSWLLFGLVAVIGPWTPRSGPAPVDGVRIVAANTFGQNPTLEATAADIVAQDPDIVVVSESTLPTVRLLAGEFPHEAVLSNRPDVTVHSRFPLRVLDPPEGISFLGERALRVAVDAPAGPFVLYALHLPPVRLTPTASDELSVTQHQRMVDKVARAIAGETLPVVVAGDLNLVDRTGGFRTLRAQLDDAMRDGWAQPTSLKFTARLIFARVDHVLMPTDWCSTDADTFALRGSDHRGVAATIGPCP